MAENTLTELRTAIDQIDEKIVELFAQRFNTTREIGAYKARQKISAVDKNREEEKYNSITKKSQALGLNPEFVWQVFRLTIDQVVKEHEQAKRSEDPG